MPFLSLFNRNCLTLAMVTAFSFAEAATITVNSGSNTAGSPTDNLCHLFEAIISSNTDTASGDLISFPNECAAGSGEDTIVFSVPGITQPNQTMVITENVTLSGDSNSFVIINGAISRPHMLTIDGTGPNTLSNVKFEYLNFINGGSGDGSESGAMLVKEAVVNIDNSRFASNRGAFAGAIRATQNASVNLSHCEFDGNISEGSGGAISLSQSEATIDQCRFYFNNAKGLSSPRNGGGGAISLQSYSSLLVTNSLFEDNRAGFGNYPETQLEDGGAINVGPVFNEVKIVNSTFSGNNSWDDGGAIYLDDINQNDVNSSLTIINSTFTNNFAGLFGNAQSQTPQGGALSIDDASSLMISNSIFSGNKAYSEGKEIYITSGTLTPDAGNLFGHNDLTTAQALVGVAAGANDVTSTSNGTIPTSLGSILDITLQNNGGDWPTHALVTDSPAIDAGINDDCTLTDQRALFRTDRACDIGAYEVGASAGDPRTQCYVLNGAGGKIVVFCL